MFDDTKPTLRLVADNTGAIAPLVDMVAHYAAEIDERRNQLSQELEHFESKLRDLVQLDPMDFTGLTKVYREHASHIRRLLSEFEQAQA